MLIILNYLYLLIKRNRGHCPDPIALGQFHITAIKIMDLRKGFVTGIQNILGITQ